MRIRTGLGLGLLLVALAAAGCGQPDDGEGVATADGVGQSATPSATPDNMSLQDHMLQYAECMRNNGVPNFPDPQVGDQGQVELKIPQGAEPAKVDAAQATCKKYLPNGGEPPKADPQMVERLLKYAQCMREHGVPKFPDPTGGGFMINQGDIGMPPDDPRFKAAEEACASLRPGPPSGGPGQQTETTG